MDTQKEILTIQEVATLTGFKVNTLYQKRHDKQIPEQAMFNLANGSKIRFYRSEIMKWITNE